MTPHGWLLIAVFVLAVGVTIRPLGVGGYMAWIFTGQHASIRFLRFFERSFFRLACVDPSSEQNWLNYAAALIIFNVAGMILLFAILILQEAMPLNPQHLGPMAADLAMNTAVITNTSWQAYAGETTLSDLSQMAGITVQSFLSAGTGMAVAIALVRGFARRSSETIGNAWVDLTRATLYVLLPICVIGALFLASQGVPQTLAGPVNASTLDGTTQIIARGPVASQEAIKLLSGDGGGFFNANSAHPYENPTALTNVFEMLLIFLIGAALTNTGDERQGWSLLGAMIVLFAVGLCVVYSAEAASNPHFAKLDIDQAPGPLQAGGNMEGKEVRFGVAGSTLFANVTMISSQANHESEASLVAIHG
jgi:K+-transporting ATPase ATPase A chain